MRQISHARHRFPALIIQHAVWLYFRFKLSYRDVEDMLSEKAALKLLRKLLKRQGCVPDAIVTDRLRSYGAALRKLGLANRHVTGGRSNNRAEVSHQPTRRREKQQRTLQVARGRVGSSAWGGRSDGVGR